MLLKSFLLHLRCSEGPLTVPGLRVKPMLTRRRARPRPCMRRGPHTPPLQSLQAGTQGTLLSPKSHPILRPDSMGCICKSRPGTTGIGIRSPACINPAMFDKALDKVLNWFPWGEVIIYSSQACSLFQKTNTILDRQRSDRENPLQRDWHSQDKNIAALVSFESL